MKLSKKGETDDSLIRMLSEWDKIVSECHGIVCYYPLFSYLFVEDTYYNNVGRCILLGLSYSLGKWDMRGKSKMKQLEQDKNLQLMKVIKTKNVIYLIHSQ